MSCRRESVLLAGKSLKILVADDNEVNLKVIIGMLEFAGHQVDSADNGEGVISALESKQYQLVVLDCMMPGMDGFEVARKIRRGESSLCDPDIPILAVTALATEADRQRCMDAGMTGFCSKPVKAEVLFAWIAKQFDFEARPATQNYSSFNSSIPTASSSGRKGRPGFNQREWVRSMSSMLIRDAADWQQQLPKLLATNNHEGLTLLAHKIKGSADVLGFQDLSAVAAQLESSGKSGKASKAPVQVSQLIAALQQVIEDVQEQS